MKELDEILKNDRVIYHKGYTATELRKMFVQSQLPDFVEIDGVYQLAEQIVNLSWKGLKARGFGEETMLGPLFERIKERTNPAKQMLTLRKQGVSLEEIIKEYGNLLT